MTKMILAIDQGTTSSRAILFSTDGAIIDSAQQEFPQIYPQDGWVEHDPEDIWSSTLSVCRQVLEKKDIHDVLGIGITNQRETTIVWDKNTGKPVYNAIVWQDRRTASFCQDLKANSLEPVFSEKTGLLLDPYFSGTKIHWILKNVPGARTKAEQGQLLFGTVDSFLLWRLTDGASHATDATNASRTLLFNIHEQQWDQELLRHLEIPESILPDIKDCAADFGMASSKWLGATLPIAGIAGDQQAALFGQACFEPGMIKSTYGTGCFMIVNTGHEPVFSGNKLLTTVGYRLNGKTTYALEGSIFVAGATVQWLRDGIGLINTAAETSTMAECVGDDQSVYLVPAFTGLGAPYWNPAARGAIVGMTRNTGPEAIVAAGLQSIAYQTKDLVGAMKRDGVSDLKGLRVDGGMVVNDWVMQFLADILEVRVDRPEVTETTALGVAFLAGLQLGLYKSLDELKSTWRCEREFESCMPEGKVDRLYSGWKKAIKGVQAIT
ncbi:MAG: glycerol kinase GlpK [Reinekea sp.]